MIEYPLALTPLETVTNYIWPLLQFLIGLGIVVIVHELGHFMAAKWAGIKVEEFAIGFGKKLWGIQRGETLYRINAVPLGGYVKMLGQDDLNPGLEVRDDSRSWQCAPAGKKVVVLAAGVVMNIVFALVVFIVVYLVGVRFPAPVVGGVDPDFPAARAGLRPGDRILAVNGKPVRKFGQIIMKAALSSEGQEFDFEIDRREDGQDKQFHVQMVPEKLDEGKYGSRFAFGISPALSMTIGQVGEGDIGYAGKEHFKVGDTIVAIDGTPVSAFWDLDRALADYAGKEVPVVVDRDGKKITVLTAAPEIRNKNAVASVSHLVDARSPGSRSAQDKSTQAATAPTTNKSESTSRELLTLLGMNCLMRVDLVSPKTTAEAAGLKNGDIIVGYGGVEDPSRSELLDINKQNVDKAVPIRLWRDQKPIDTTVTPQQKAEDAVIGIAVAPAAEPTIVASVQEGSPAAAAGLSKGCLITAIDGSAVKTWGGMYGLLAAKQGQAVKLTYTLNGQEHTATLDVPANSLGVDKYTFDLPPLTVLGGGATGQMLTDPVRGDPLKAIVWSGEDALEWTYQSYQTLARIFEGRVSAKEVSGPVGIGQIAIAQARKSPVDFTYFIAMLSAMLAVFNFLPWPALDGGHFVIVLIEKARGKPLSPKVMTGIQMVGITVLLGIFLMVTFNDILRLFR